MQIKPPATDAVTKCTGHTGRRLAMREPGAPRPYALATAEAVGVPHADAVGITEDWIRAVVDEFYRRARRDDQLGPIFAAHIDDWDQHLARMADFWSASGPRRC